MLVIYIFLKAALNCIAANLVNRRYLGIDMETEFLEICENKKIS